MDNQVHTCIIGVSAHLYINFGLSMQMQILKIAGEALPVLRESLIAVGPKSEFFYNLLAATYLALSSKWKDPFPPSLAT